MVSFGYGGVAFVLAIAVVALAYGTQSPQLGVAEFAPSARRALETPPTTTSEQLGGGRRSGGRATTTTTAAMSTTASSDAASAAAAPTTRLARTRACVGAPPRQIEDPMSPPCVGTIFEGDNGGATTRGVTSTEIAVAVPSGSWCSVNTCQAFISALFEFFNQRFEFYGRRLRPVFLYGSDNDATGARALGAEIASRQVFGALTGPAEWDLVGAALFQELGRQHVVTVMRGQHFSDRTLLDDLHPYLWSTQPSTEQWQRNVASFTCASLAGHLASHAGTAGLRSSTRKFGVVTVGDVEAPPSSTLLGLLRDCGIEPQTLTWGTSAAAANQLRTGMESFRTAGVTTMICVCSGYSMQTVSSALEPLTDYRPEWLRSVTWFPQQERTAGSQQMLPSTFGISADPKVLPVQAQSWHQAIVSVADPKLMASSGYGFIESAAIRLVYEELLILAAGIQSAGPALTPDTFAAGLMATQFPNSGAGQAPYWQSSVGFGPGDHSFLSDFSISWWGTQAPVLEPEIALERPTGSWCYANQGARYSVGTYPANADDLLFRADLPCR